MPSPAFVEAAAYLSSAPSLATVSNATRLEVEQLYGLYKHLTVAPVPESARPSLFDLTGRAKWDAWSSAGKRYAGDGADAEKRYLDVARELGWTPGSGVAAEGGEVWDEDLGVSISLSSAQGGGGMGGAVSAMAASRDKAAEGQQPLHVLALQGDVGGLTRLLADKSSPLDVDRRDEYGYTALHLACDRGSLPVVRALIRHGADATIKDPDDLTGMELAHVAGHDDICAFLRTELRY